MARPFRSLFRAARRDQRGAVTIITAASLTGLLAATAFAVDMGSIYLADRKLQGMADLAALAAAEKPSVATAAVQQMLTNASAPNTSIASVVTGAYTPDGKIPVAQRFTPASATPNAVQVTLVQSVPLFFGGIFTGHGTTQVRATATAARIDYAAFSIGTRLASLNGGVANDLLEKLAGTSLDLKVADYNALVGTQINLLSFSQELATQLHLTAASFNDTLDAKATLPQILSALSKAAPDSPAAPVLDSLALRVPSTTVQLSNLIDLGPYGGQDHADPSTVISADGYSILRETLALANGSRQVSLNAGLTLPGLTSTDANLAIGQRPENSPWLTVAKDGNVIVRTAQARLYIDAKILGSGSILDAVSIHLPLYVELASAQAKLTNIDCQQAASPSVTLSVAPGVGTVAIADMSSSNLSNFNTAVTPRTAIIAKALVPLVKAKAVLPVGGQTWQPLNFTSADIAAGNIQTVSTGDITQSVATALIKTTQLKAIGLDLGGVTGAVGALLTPLAPALDGLVDQLTGLLGVHVGEADLKINGVRCGKPALVA